MPKYGSKENSTSVATPSFRIRSSKRLKKFSDMFRTDQIRFTVTGRSGSPRQIQQQWAKILAVAANRLVTQATVEERARSSRRLLKLARRVRPFGAKAEVTFESASANTQKNHSKWANICTVAAQRLLANVPANIAAKCRNVEA